MVTTEWMLEAYFDCRHSKRTSASSIVYEMNYEEKLICLRDRINDRTYRPGKYLQRHSRIESCIIILQ